MKMCQQPSLVRCFSLVFISVSSLLSISCATLEITTEPAGAEIVAVSAAGGVASPLGKSPVLLDSGKIAELLKQGPAIIRATAEGFETTHLLVPTSLRGEVKASVTLKKVASDKAADAPEKKADLNALIRNILDAERSIIEKRFDDAKRLATKIREDFPALAISYFLEGSVYFKQGDRAAALASMNRGLELDPDDVVTKKFVEQFGKEQNTGAN
ncbi:MAG: hypothetical protein RJB13_1836 [Pseudomonadota bacterium]